ncbi:response regulator receiver modulated diguanylate cyclase [Arthrospira platensis C1]|nr:response regulator receiver modulated diguanylate cyclase [Arthrospira platensis C1]
MELMQAVATQLSFPRPQAGLDQQLKQANFKLDRLARLDGLTQLANRGNFHEFWWREWRRMHR